MLAPRHNRQVAPAGGRIRRRSDTLSRCRQAMFRGVSRGQRVSPMCPQVRGPFKSGMAK